MKYSRTLAQKHMLLTYQKYMKNSKVFNFEDVPIYQGHDPTTSNGVPFQITTNLEGEEKKFVDYKEVTTRSNYHKFLMK